MSQERIKRIKRIKQTDIAREVCKREESKGREVNISDVSRVLRHTFTILSEMEYGDREVFLDQRFKYYGSKKK